MKLRLFIFSTIVLLFASTSVFSQWTRYTKYLEGKKYTFLLAPADLKDTPSWNGKDEIPLSLNNAVEIARTSLLRLVPRSADKWDVSEVSLQKVYGADKWYYSIDFNCDLKECLADEELSRYIIFVKMNGTIVEPQIEPWDKEQDGKVY
jgi:hypothetical protein